MHLYNRGVLALTVSLALTSFSGCLSTRKYARNEIKASSDALNKELSGKIDATNGQVKETQDSVNRVDTRVTQVDQRVSTVDTRVTGVDTKVTGVSTKVDELSASTTQSVNGLKTDVSGVNTKADTATRNLATLDQKFTNRNNYSVGTTKNVLFSFDSAKLSKDAMAPLDEIAQAVTSNPDAILVLEGHTDSTGDKDYNVKLGERRVEAVKRYLAVDKGVPVYKIEEISFGADKPVVPNDSKQNREQNRTVTLSILVPSASGYKKFKNNQQGKIILKNLILKKKIIKKNKINKLK
jgi:outer membrane protein OmpA-like peptidoglycan-associated protein